VEPVVVIVFDRFLTTSGTSDTGEAPVLREHLVPDLYDTWPILQQLAL